MYFVGDLHIHSHFSRATSKQLTRESLDLWGWIKGLSISGPTFLTGWRKNIEDRPGRDPFYSLVPLKEILAELEGVGAGSKRVAGRYAYCINRLGPEMEILLYMKIEELEKEGDIRLSRAVQAMRKRQVRAEPGYDGEYGIVSIHRAAASEPPLFSSLPDAEGGLSAKGESRCLYVSRARIEPAETLAFSSLQGCGLYYPRWR